MKRSYLLAGLLASVALPGLAQAQQIEEIMVTAQKRSESIREVPQAISVLTGDQLDRVGAKELADLAAYLPGVAVRGGSVGNRTIVLRGIATNATSSADSRLVGIYVDDVAYGSSTFFAGSANNDLDLSMFDLDRVEVLNGPQGTLYGASSMGGVLKYVTKSPNLHDYEAKAEASFGAISGGDTDRGFRAMVNAPIVNDKVAARVQAYHQDFGGYVDNISPLINKKDVGGVETYGGRAQLLLAPTDNLSIKLMALGQDMRRVGGNAIQWNAATNAPLYGDLDHLTQNTPGAEPNVQRFRLYSITGDYDLGFAKLTAVAAQQSSTAQNIPDLTTTLAAIFPQFGVTKAPVAYGSKILKNNAEVRLASAGGGPIEWLVGGYYDNEKVHQTQVVSAFNAAGPIPVDFGHVNLQTYYRELAAFANGTYHLTDAWDVTLGLRGARTDMTYEQISSGLLVGGSLPPNGDRSYIVNYAASTKYKFSDLGMVYARFATGYRPGGPNVQGRNSVTGQLVGDPVVGADKTKNYEIGAKIEPLKWLAIDLVAYHIDWDNIQLNVQFNGIGVRGNGKGAQSDGSELTVQARPIKGLVLSGTMSYTDAHLTDPVTDQRGLLANANDPLPGTPKWSGSLNADYEFPVWADWNGSVGGGWSYVGERNSNFLGTATKQTAPNFVMPSYNQVNLRAGLANERYSIQFFVRNLADERGFATATNTAASGRISSSTVTFIQPRTIGVTFDAQF